MKRLPKIMSKGVKINKRVSKISLLIYEARGGRNNFVSVNLFLSQKFSSIEWDYRDFCEGG